MDESEDGYCILSVNSTLWYVTAQKKAWADRGICPSGFHVPTYNDFYTLVNTYHLTHAQWGGPGHTQFWSDTQIKSNTAWDIFVPNGGAATLGGSVCNGGHTCGKTNAVWIRCLQDQSGHDVPI